MHPRWPGPARQPVLQLQRVPPVRRPVRCSMNHPL